MGISVKGGAEDLKARFEAFARAIEEKKVELLEKAGEEAITYARSDHPRNWENRTVNLRSSVGYAIYDDGEPLKETFVGAGALPVEANTGSSTAGAGSVGVAEGQKLAQSVASSKKGLTLVVTAGMHYATYVEARGFDVLSGAKLKAERFVQTEMPNLVKKIHEDWDKMWK